MAYSSSIADRAPVRVIIKKADEHILGLFRLKT